MKKVLIIALCILGFTGCATNFNSWNDWAKDKEGPKVAAEVLEARVENGVNYAKVRVYSTGEVKNVVQKPYFKSTEAFQKGTTIFVNP